MQPSRPRLPLAAMTFSEVDTSMKADPIVGAPAVCEIEASTMGASPSRRALLQRQGVQALAEIDAMVRNQQKKARGVETHPRRGEKSFANGMEVLATEASTKTAVEFFEAELDTTLNSESPHAAPLPLNFTPHPVLHSVTPTATPVVMDFSPQAGGLWPGLAGGCCPLECATQHQGTLADQAACPGEYHYANDDIRRAAEYEAVHGAIQLESATDQATCMTEYHYANDDFRQAAEYEAAHGAMCRAFLAQALVAAAPDSYED